MKKAPPRIRDPKFNAWKLVPSDAIQYSERAAAAAAEAKALLKNVVDEHPGTPWAVLAQRELNHPLGFKWMETYVNAAHSETKNSMADDVNMIHFTKYQSCSGLWPLSLRGKYEFQPKRTGSSGGLTD
jgi:hypothetical protein